MIHWGNLKNFSKNEFPDGVEAHCSFLVFTGLQRFRDALGHSIMPSPLEAGWFRFGEKSKGSRHYAVGRSSDAGDIFPDCAIAKSWRVAVSMRIWGGIGVYFDTSPRPMLHLDMRPTPEGVLPLWWCRIDGKYFYPVNGLSDSRIFFEALYKGE